jgi:hypothetical protein
MAQDQKYRSIASSTKRTPTWTPISSESRWMPLWLVATALLLASFLVPTQVLSALASPARVVAPELYLGLVYPGAPEIPTLRTYETRIGKGASIVMWYQAWSEDNQMQSFPAAQMESVRVHGSIPMLAWEPAANPGPLNQPAFSLAKIADGAWDTYLRQYASEAKDIPSSCGLPAK